MCQRLHAAQPEKVRHQLPTVVVIANCSISLGAKTYFLTALLNWLGQHKGGLLVLSTTCVTDEFLHGRQC